MIRVKTILLFLVGMNIGYIDIFAQYNVTEKFQERLNQFRTHYIQVMLKNKTADLAGYYAESIWLLPEFQKTVIGKNDVLLYHKAFLSRFKIREYTRNEIEIRDLGTQILEVGKFTMKMTLLNSDQQQELKGAYINLWEKLENDRLMLITEAWNYDTYYEGIDKIMRFDEVPSIHLALQPNVPVDSNISFELAAFNRLLDVTVTQHDANVWSRYYADDSMLIPNYHPICDGRNAIDKYITMHVKELPVFEGLDIRNHRIDDLDTYVIEYASHVASWKN